MTDVKKFEAGEKTKHSNSLEMINFGLYQLQNLTEDSSYNITEKKYFIWILCLKKDKLIKSKCDPVSVLNNELIRFWWLLIKFTV